MRLLVKLIVFSLCILGFFRTGHADSNNSSQLMPIRAIADEYCRSEFNGDEYIRQDLATYSRKRIMEVKKSDPELIQLRFIGWESDPLYIVSAYKIIDIKIGKKQAVASVEYVRLARTEGFGHLDRKIIPDYNEQDVVLLNLVYEKGKWKILDPPLPRISKDALYKYFMDTKIRLEQNVIGKPETSEAQKQYYLKIKENLEILEKLRNN